MTDCHVLIIWDGHRLWLTGKWFVLNCQKLWLVALCDLIWLQIVTDWRIIIKMSEKIGQVKYRKKFLASDLIIVISCFDLLLSYL